VTAEIACANVAEDGRYFINGGEAEGELVE